MARFVPSVDEVAEEVWDGLVEQFVVEARVDGLSWTRIAELVGTSERAAQERYAASSVLAGAWPGELADRFAGP